MTTLPARPAAPLVCSAKGCRSAAVWGLRWNNPRLHEPERRKTWLACDQHLESLSQFLSVRDFLRETVPADTLPTDGAGAQPLGS